MARRLLFTPGALCGDDYTVNIDIIGSSQLGGVPTALTDSVSDLRPQRSAGSLGPVWLCSVKFFEKTSFYI